MAEITVSSSLQWSNISLSQPEWLWLLLPFFLLWLIYYLRPTLFSRTVITSLQQNRHLLLFHPLADKLLEKQETTRQHGFSALVYSIVFVLMVIALSQPVIIEKKLPQPIQQREITFIVDTSVSMILRDYMLQGKRIDRMTLLKGVLNNFIRQLSGEKMSIIVFGDHAYTLVPLTADHALLGNMLMKTRVTMAGRFNAIGEALLLGIKQASANRQYKRIIIILSDADQPTGNIDPRSVSKLAREKQLPVYTVAIGASTKSAAEKKRGGLLYSPVDLSLLKDIANTSGGKSYHASNANSLQQAINDINQLSRHTQKGKPLYFTRSLHQYFIIAAVILFSMWQGASLFFPYRREKKLP